jgi:hypothetical protein
MKSSRLRLYRSTTNLSFIIRCTTSSPDVRTSEAMGSYLLVDHRLQSLYQLLFIGCATSAPDGSSPRGYSRNFLGIGSKI